MTARRTAILAEARRWIGTPFVHGQSRIGAGCDCLGLVLGVWRAQYAAARVTPPFYGSDGGNRQEAEALRQGLSQHLNEIAPEAAQPADVVLFRLRDAAPARHLGLLSMRDGDWSLIHAHEAFGVLEDRFSENWRRRAVAAFAWPGETR